MIVVLDLFHLFNAEMLLFVVGKFSTGIYFQFLP